MFLLPERSVLMNLGPVRHNGQLVQTGLSIKQNNIVVVQMPFHQIPQFQVLGQLLSVSVFEKFLERRSFLLDVVSTGPLVRSVDDQLPHSVDVRVNHSLGESENFCDVHRNTDLVDL
jgi:hypothetical protein